MCAKFRVVQLLQHAMQHAQHLQRSQVVDRHHWNILGRRARRHFEQPRPHAFVNDLHVLRGHVTSELAHSMLCAHMKTAFPRVYIHMYTYVSTDVYRWQASIPPCRDTVRTCLRCGCPCLLPDNITQSVLGFVRGSGAHLVASFPADRLICVVRNAYFQSSNAYVSIPKLYAWIFPRGRCGFTRTFLSLYLAPWMSHSHAAVRFRPEFANLAFGRVDAMHGRMISYMFSAA